MMRFVRFLLKVLGAVLAFAPTRFGGHSLVVDPATHRIFVACFGSIAVYEPVSQP